jgi:hypothetical protein
MLLLLLLLLLLLWMLPRRAFKVVTEPAHLRFGR